MGEARRRGTYEERKTAAIEKEHARIEATRNQTPVRSTIGHIHPMHPGSLSTVLLPIIAGGLLETAITENARTDRRLEKKRKR